MIKIICDKCEKEIKEVVIVAVKGLFEWKFDLCNECATDFNNLVGGFIRKEVDIK